MAITNRTCISFCNQPKAKFGYLTRVTPVCPCLTRLAGGSIWLHQESLRHILASPGYTPGTIAVNVTPLKRGFNACKTSLCIYPSIFNRLPVIQPRSSKVRYFSTFFAHFGFPWVRPWDNRSKCHTVGKRIQCL